MEMKGLFSKVIIGILVIVVAVAAFFVIQGIGKGNTGINPSVQVTTITPTPSVTAPKFEIITLSVPECPDCFAIDAFAYVLQENGAKVNQQKFTYSSEEGKKLLKQFNITKVPTIIISGDVDKVKDLEALLIKAGEKFGSQYVLKDIAPPYLDLTTGKVVGKVDFTTIYEPGCVACKHSTVPIYGDALNSSQLAEYLKQVYGIVANSDKEFTAQSKEGSELIQKYSITMLPAIIVSKDIETYPEFATAFKRIGTIESDGNYILRNLNPPFYNLTSGKEEGKITMVFIKAGASCEPSCYDYTVHVGALTQLGVVASTTLYYDYDSPVGKNFTKIYNITKVPTLLISPEVKGNAAFMFVHKQIGEFEKDGWFVFRNFEVLEESAYFDLALNKTVTTPKLPATAQ
ncbi:hypothetical protein HY989_05380 [Candidatus Micrarchaeota archaeon]|nr:hypothetical protein [Candidatus Micrarchaeota archaeon]